MAANDSFCINCTSDDYDRFYFEYLQIFHVHFLHIHGYASVVVCVFGIITNALNITVLLSKDMQTPTNHLLACLALSDILTMLPYIPFAVHFYCPPADPRTHPEKFTYNWIFYLIVTTQLTATTHTISIWLAVTLAAFRYFQIRSSCPRGPLADQRRLFQVRVAAAIVYLASVLVQIPHYLASEITLLAGTNGTMYSVKDPKLGTSEADPTYLSNWLTYAILNKIVPCALILLFSGSLVHHMSVKMTRRRQRLSAARQQVNTTRMLLVVLILFLVVELPQGVLMVFSAALEGFHTNIYYFLGELVDFLALLNNAINFVLYCIMSQQFREKFTTLYITPILNRRRQLLASGSELLILREQPMQRPPNTTQTTNIHEDLAACNGVSADGNTTSSPLKA